MAVKVLIVEDESIVARDIQQTLKRLGYEVLAVTDNAQDAVEKARSLDPDIILMDIMIKGEKNGIQAAEEIKKHKNIPIIFLTAYADVDTINKAKETNPYGYIIKPYKALDLHTTIQITINKHTEQQKIQEERDMLYSLVTTAASKETHEDDKIIFIKSRSKQVKLNTKDIYFIEALKDYVTINTSEAKYTIHSTMKEIEKKLPQKHFIRTHRSFIVRIDKIKLIEQSNIVLENNKKIIPVGASYKDALMEKINTL